MQSTFTDYAPGGSTSGGEAASGKDGGYWSLQKCRKAYLDYLGNKQDEINEQKDARRYYHGAQWTAEQIKALNLRKQPVVTFNRIARKLNGVVGLIERLRQDPKAYPRTPQHEQGAELATAVVRYVLDEQEWKTKSPEVALDASIDGYGGIVLELTQGDKGDPEVSFECVETDSFFYDPRSYRPDFSDAMFMGEAKWLDVETAQSMFPDKADEIAAAADNASDLSTNPDRENKFFSFEGGKPLIRLVDIWYRHKGKWCWTFFTGSMVLAEGQSYLTDEKKQTICRYIMFSCNVDQDGDRYGFVRNMKSAQDEYNARRSRALFTANSRRLIMSQGAVEDVEKVRREWARPDGVVVTNAKTPDEGIKADDAAFDFAGQLKLMENAIAELENYGPNQALVGDVQNQSGRAIQLLQQAGMAELGPYIMGYRGWKLRVYRAVFNAVQQYWTAERWIRVTDDEGLAQFVQINGVQIDPMTGMPTLVNALGSLDVDIIMDEGADSINIQADAYETLSVLAGKGAQIPPQALIELAPLPGSVKKKILDKMEQAAQAPNMELQAEQARMQGEAQLDREKLQVEADVESRKVAIQSHAKQQELAAKIHADERAAAIEIQKNRELAQLEREKAEAAYNLKLMELQADIAADQQRLAFDADVKMAQAEFDFSVERHRADNEARAGEVKEKTDSGIQAVIKELAEAQKMTKVATKTKDGQWRVEAVG